MNTIKFSIFLFLLTISLPGFTQERVNRPKLKFEASSDTLTKATGWAYNETLGEWIDYENSISDDNHYKKDNGRLEPYIKYATYQNFNFITSQTLKFKGIKFYLLSINKTDDTSERTFGFIFTENEYQKLNKIDSIVDLKTNIMVIFPFHEEFNETLFLDLIQTALNTESTEYASTYLFPVMKSKEGMIRFYLPDLFNEYRNYDFDKAYFEVDPKSFSKIILK
jgi:hypothetical protein